MKKSFDGIFLKYFMPIKYVQVQLIKRFWSDHNLIKITIRSGRFDFFKNQWSQTYFEHIKIFSIYQPIIHVSQRLDIDTILKIFLQ